MLPTSKKTIFWTYSGNLLYSCGASSLPVMSIDDKLGEILMTHHTARGRAHTRKYSGWKM